MNPLERLLAQMPKIAEAVNAFGSEEVQKLAFTALMREIRGTSADDHPDEDDEQPAGEHAAVPVGRQRGASRRFTKAPSGIGAGGKQRSHRAAAGPSIDGSLNLRPKGGTSFADFAAEKAPSNINEQNVVAVYYLQRIAGQAPVTANQVYTCYKDRSWRVPKDIRNGLQKTAAERGWLNTKKTDDLKVTVPGENYVEHDLPAKKAK